MKLFFLSGILFLSTLLSLSAQQKENSKFIKDSFNTEQPKASSNYFLNFGLNVLDDGNSALPFNANEMSFKNPFFASIERRSTISNFSPVLSLSTNKLKVDGVDRFYLSIDAVARYYFDDYIFNNSDIETYAGLGLGHFFLGDKGNSTFNFNLGGRYWFLKNFAISIQGNGKQVLKKQEGYALSHFAYNLGIVWKISSKKKVIKHFLIESPIASKEDLIKDKEEVVALREGIIKEKEELVALKESLIKEKEVLIAKNDGGEIVEGKAIAEVPVEALDSTLKDLDLPMDTLSPFDYSGDWDIKITNAKNNVVVINNSLFSTYSAYVNDGTMWISDFKKGVWLQCKIKVNYAKGTFTATNEPNTIDKGTVTITEGKFEKKKELTKPGIIVDKIYFKAQFSYDPSTILIFEGQKSN
jgi:hypothetical protein